MKYELMAIISNELTEKDAQSFFQKEIIDKIKNLKGEITFEDFWGSRGFAYKINKQTWGYYFVLQFEIDQKAIDELKQEFNLDKKIVRFLIIKVDPKAEEPKKYSEIQKEVQKIQEKQEEEKKLKKEPTKKDKPKKEEKKSKEIEEDKEAKKEEITKKTEEPKKKEQKKDEVDKKLDAILEDSSLDL